MFKSIYILRGYDKNYLFFSPLMSVEVKFEMVKTENEHTFHGERYRNTDSTFLKCKILVTFTINMDVYVHVYTTSKSFQKKVFAISFRYRLCCWCSGCCYFFCWQVWKHVYAQAYLNSLLCTQFDVHRNITQHIYVGFGQEW